MRAALLDAATAGSGVLTRLEALGRSPRHVLDDAVRAGVLVRAFPSVYVLDHLADDRLTMLRAALAYLPAAAISHVDALHHWQLEGLSVPLSGRPHVTVPGDHRRVDARRLTVHRRRGFSCAPPETLHRGDLRVVRLEQAVVESWPLLLDTDRRAPGIIAVRTGRTTAERLLAAVSANRRTAGATEMRTLFEAIRRGCHSELELWGHDHVFADPRLPPALLQHPLSLGRRTVRLDRYYPAEMTAVELDGAAYHGSQAQRERDIRRDAAISALGILVLRYSHRRLFSEPTRVVDEMLRVLAMRRQQLSA